VTTLDPFSGRRSRRRRRLLRPVVFIATAVALFAIGLALGMALNDRPEPGGTQTLVRTLEPLPQRSP
jgi:hypothetical protein